MSSFKHLTLFPSLLPLQYTPSGGMPHSTDIPERSIYGNVATGKLFNGVDDPSLHNADATVSLVLKTIRLLIADLCQHFHGGHLG